MVKELPFPYVLWPLFFAIPLIALSHFSFVVDPYTPAKWISFYFLAIICSFILFTDLYKVRQIIKIRWSLMTTLCLIIAFVGMMINLYINWNLPLQSQILDWLCFFFVAFFSYRYITNEESLFRLLLSIVIGSVFVSIYGHLQYFIPELNPTSHINFFPVSTFGFQNMTAEFVSISLFVTIYLEDWVKTKKSKVIFLLLFYFQLVYFLMLASRAAFLSVMIAYAIHILITKKYKNIFIHFLVCLLAIGTFAQFEKISKISITTTSDIKKVNEKVVHDSSYQKTDSIFSSSKVANTKKRLIRWLNTLYMIRDRPLGIGIGNYEYAYIDYNNAYLQDSESSELIMPKSPHNAYLELVAEYGLIVSLSLFVLLFLFLKKVVLFKAKDHFSSQVRSMTIPLFCLYAVNACFNFPLENGVPFALASIFVGLSFRCLLCDHGYKKIKLNLGIYFLIPTVIIMILGYRVIISKVLESDLGNINAARKSCELMAENWKACLNLARLQVEEKSYWAAIKTHNRILYYYPNNFSSLRALSYIYYINGNRIDACHNWKKYRDLLKGQVPKFDLADYCLDGGV